MPPTRTPALNTRKPTGKVAYPLILVEGEEKGGKSYLSYQLSASPRVGRTFVLDLTDGTADEYARLGPYEILVHDGTFASMVGQIKAAAAVTSDPERPNVIVVDSGSYLWSFLSDWADWKARNRRANQRRLAEDPDAEVIISHDLWNEAKSRWGEVIGALKVFPGVAIVTAQGKEVVVVENGEPTKDRTWKVEAEKSLPATVNAWVRVRRDPRSAHLVAVRSLDVEDLPAGGLELPLQGALEHLVFGILGAGQEGAVFGQSTAVRPTVGTASAEAKARVLEAVARNWPTFTEEERKARANQFWTAEFGDQKPEEVHPDRLAKVLVAIGDAGMADDGQKAAPAPQEQAPAPSGPAEATTAPQAAPEPTPGPSEPPASTEPPVGLPLEEVERIQGMSVAGLSAELRGLGETPKGKKSDLQDQLADALMARANRAANPPADEGQGVDELAMRRVANMTKPDLVEECHRRGLPTAGNMDALRERVLTALEGEDPPESAEDPVAIPPTPDDGGTQDGEEPRPATAGWVQTRCEKCGGSAEYERGNYMDTLHHHLASRDQDHDVAEGF